MSLLNNLDRADISRETAVAILRGFVTYGSRAEFAARLGISKQYLSVLSQVSHDASRVLPSPELVKAIADHLPAPDHYRGALRDYFEEARLDYDAGKRQVQSSCTSSLELRTTIDEIRKALSRALFTQDFEGSRRQYQHALTIGTQLLRQLSPEIYPLEFLEACSPVIHASYALDNSGLGVFWAKLGTRVAEELSEDRGRFPRTEDRERLARLSFLASRDEAIGYHNLKQPQLALQRYERLQATLTGHRRNRDWSADVYRNSVLSYAALPRFAMSEVLGLADVAGDHFAGKGDRVSALLNQESLARALIAHGTPLNFRRAEAILQSLLGQVERLPNAGPLHRATILRTTARLYWRQGDLNNWKHFLLRTIDLAEQAGLARLRRRLNEEYGDVLSPAPGSDEELVVALGRYRQPAAQNPTPILTALS